MFNYHIRVCLANRVTFNSSDGPETSSTLSLLVFEPHWTGVHRALALIIIAVVYRTRSELAASRARVD